LHIPFKHENVTEVTRPSFPTQDTESDPHWGWWGSGNETTFYLASVRISKLSLNRGVFF